MMPMATKREWETFLIRICRWNPGAPLMEAVTVQNHYQMEQLPMQMEPTAGLSSAMLEVQRQIRSLLILHMRMYLAMISGHPCPVKRCLI